MRVRERDRSRVESARSCRRRHPPPQRRRSIVSVRESGRGIEIGIGMDTIVAAASTPIATATLHTIAGSATTLLRRRDVR